MDHQAGSSGPSIGGGVPSEWQGKVSGLFRHPVKGFTPESLEAVQIQRGGHFPNDRVYAVELGPSGYDPERPNYLKKTKFAVLANSPRLAAVKTSFDHDSRVLKVDLPGGFGFKAELATPSGRQTLANWLTDYLSRSTSDPPLSVVEASGSFRFMDDSDGLVSLINLASLRELGARLGCDIDPLRFRANVYIDGWPPWSELELPEGAAIRIGSLELLLVKPIKRCIATHVNVTTGLRDLDVVGGLVDSYGHPFCGLYLRPTSDGSIAIGDRAVSRRTG